MNRRFLWLAVAGLCACNVSAGSMDDAFVTAGSASASATAAEESGSSGEGSATSTSATGSSTTASSTSPDSSGGPVDTSAGDSCGDGVIDPGEECDAAQFGGLGCADFDDGNGPFTGGSLQCSASCQIVTSECTLCGDALATGDEACDGEDLAGATCVSRGFDAGTLVCTAACELDDSGCTGCGDGVVDATEDCDGGVAGTTCADEGFDGGTLACGADCLYDTTGCFTCGDGVIAGTEECDCGGNACTAAELGNQDCTDFDSPNGGPFTGGTLACTNACAFNTSQCTGCGDGIQNGSEDCDGNDLGTGDCSDIGWLGGGMLSCNADCSYDDSSCQGPLCGTPDAGVGGCPAACSSCAAGWCIFDCPGDIINGGPCNNQVLDCPAGWPCRLLCGDAGCVGTTFNCSDGVCEVDCDGIDACGENAQTTLDVNCGIQSCTATCDIFTEPLLNCGASCDCVPC